MFILYHHDHAHKSMIPCACLSDPKGHVRVPAVVAAGQPPSVRLQLKRGAEISVVRTAFEFGTEPTSFEHWSYNITTTR